MGIGSFFPEVKVSGCDARETLPQNMGRAPYGLQLQTAMESGLTLIACNGKGKIHPTTGHEGPER